MDSGFRRNDGSFAIVSPSGPLQNRMDRYYWRPSSLEPPLSFGHFPRERGKPLGLCKGLSMGEGGGDFPSPAGRERARVRVTGVDKGAG